MIQRCTNHPSHSESLKVVQFFQRCIIPWLHKSFEVYKFCNEVKNHSAQYKSFNVIKIIQRGTNCSTQYKSLNVIHIFKVVQIFQCSTNLSTQHKFFNAVQMIIERCTNLSNLSPDLLIIYDFVIQQSWRSLILAIFMET